MIFKSSEIAVFLHLYYLDLWPEITQYLDNLDTFDLYITLPEQHRESDLSAVLDKYPNTQLYFVENKGRDIRPFLYLLDQTPEYSYYCKIHTKKSPHLNYGDSWRKGCLNALLGSRSIITENLKLLNSHALGMIAPREYLIPFSYFQGENTAMVSKVLAEHSIDLDALQEFEYATGTMFWFNASGRNIFNRLCVYFDQFETEEGATDGTIAHALERTLIPLLTANNLLYTDEQLKVDNLELCKDLPAEFECIENYNQTRLNQYIDKLQIQQNDNFFKRILRHLS